MLRILVADDEKPARDRIRHQLNELDMDIKVVAEATGGREAVKLILRERPDLVLLDIQMPVLNGFDVVELLNGHMPAVIFVTAYDEYALQAFKVHAVDYLLKPVRKERLEESLRRVMASSSEPGHSEVYRLLQDERVGKRGGIRKIPVYFKQEILLLDYDVILYFQAENRLTRAITTDGRYRVDHSLEELEEKLRNESFFRIHRSTLVNLQAAQKMDPWFGGYRLVLSNGTELEIARRRLPDLKVHMGL